MNGEPNGRSDPAAEEPRLPAGLSDTPQTPIDINHPLAVLGQVLAVVYQLQAEVHEQTEKTAYELAALRRQLTEHMADEEPRFRLIQYRMNFLTALALATTVFSVVGTDGLRQIIDWVSGQHVIGVDGIVTLIGAAAPVLYWLRRKVFLNLERKPKEA